MARRGIISGVFETAMGPLPEQSCMSLHAESARGALADAGLEFSDIDGVLCAYSFAQPHMMLSTAFCEYMGIQPRFTTALQLGGATACSMVMQAVMLVESGICRHVLLVTGDNRLTGVPRAETDGAFMTGVHPEFERPFGISVPAAYALVAQRYMHEYTITREQLAAVAVIHRQNAALHPHAHMRAPITVQDVASSRLIASPLRLLDCCLISDGGAAVIVSGSDAAADLPRPPIAVLGAGQGHTHEHIVAAPSLTSFGCEEAASHAFAKAGISRKNIDVAEIYDSFTITLLVELESIGFFERGEAGAAALKGELSIGGRLPCNTHGGLLSYGHAGAAGGMAHIVEAIRQLRGEAGPRQVQDAKIAYVHGEGGIMSAHCSLILGRL